MTCSQYPTFTRALFVLLPFLLQLSGLLSPTPSQNVFNRAVQHISNCQVWNLKGAIGEMQLAVESIVNFSLFFFFFTGQLDWSTCLYNLCFHGLPHFSLILFICKQPVHMLVFLSDLSLMNSLCLLLGCFLCDEFWDICWQLKTNNENQDKSCPAHKVVGGGVCVCVLFRFHIVCVHVRKQFG